MQTPPNPPAAFTFPWGPQPQLRIQIKVHRKVTKNVSEKEMFPSFQANSEKNRVTCG